MKTETLYERTIRVMDSSKQRETGRELYSITVFHYDYASGETTSTNYWRNPFNREQKEFTVIQNINHGDFFPSLTRQLAMYV